MVTGNYGVNKDVIYNDIVKYLRSKKFVVVQFDEPDYPKIDGDTYLELFMMGKLSAFTLNLTMMILRVINLNKLIDDYDQNDNVIVVMNQYLMAAHIHMEDLLTESEKELITYIENELVLPIYMYHVYIDVPWKECVRRIQDTSMLTKIKQYEDCFNKYNQQVDNLYRIDGTIDEVTQLIMARLHCDAIIAN